MLGQGCWASSTAESQGRLWALPGARLGRAGNGGNEARLDKAPLASHPIRFVPVLTIQPGGHDDGAVPPIQGSIAMAHPNEDLVREAFAAFGRGDLDALRNQYLEADVRFHVPGRSPVAGDHEGVDQVLALFGKFFELSGGTLRLETHDVVANDEHAVALFVTRGERAAGGWKTALSRSCTSAMARRPRPGSIQRTSTPATSSGPDLAQSQVQAAGPPRPNTV